MTVTPDITSLPPKPRFDKKQIAIGAGLALTGVAAVLVVRQKFNVRVPDVDIDVKTSTPKK